MRSKTILNFLVLASLALGAITVVTPAASAQAVSSAIVMTVAPPTDPIQPLSAPVSFTGTVTLTSDWSGESSVTGIPVTYTAVAPPWATVIISPAQGVFLPPTGSPTPGASYSSQNTITISVLTTEQAPAFVPGTVQINAVTASSGAGGKGTQGTTSFPITAGYFSVLSVAVTDPVQVARPQQPVSFPLEITNLGNANTKVTITPDNPPEGLQIQTPAPQIVQSKQAGSTTNTVTVPLTIQTPYHNGYLNQVSAINYKITSAYANNPKFVGDTSEVSVVLTTRGFYVPGFEPGLLVIALAGLALVIGVRRRLH